MKSFRRIKLIALNLVSIFLLIGLPFALIRMQTSNGGEPEAGKVFLDVPFVRQRSWFCSEASASMVLGYYGYNFSQDQINEMGYDTFENMLPLLSRYIEAEYGSLTIADLKKEVDEKDPVILRILSDRYPHTIVVVGYSSRYIYIHDPAVGPSLSVEPEVLISVWWPTNFSAIVFEP